MDIDGLRNRVRAQRNRADIVLLICAQEHAYLLAHLLHTELEDIQEKQQDITEQFCVESK